MRPAMMTTKTPIAAYSRRMKAIEPSRMAPMSSTMRSFPGDSATTKRP